MTASIKKWHSSETWYTTERKENTWFQYNSEATVCIKHVNTVNKNNAEKGKNKPTRMTRWRMLCKWKTMNMMFVHNKHSANLFELFPIDSDSIHCMTVEWFR